MEWARQNWVDEYNEWWNYLGKVLMVGYFNVFDYRINWG
jgi:hypothetical protein